LNGDVLADKMDKTYMCLSCITLFYKELWHTSEMANKLFDSISGVYLRLLSTEFYPIYRIDLWGIQKIDPIFGLDLLVNAFLSASCS
jgi:hypothetical protein